MDAAKSLQATQFEGETFIINTKSTQNHTWQGTVRWNQKEVPFRSALELIKLMDSAIHDGEF